MYKNAKSEEEILNSRRFGGEMANKKVTNWTKTTEMRNQRELAYKKVNQSHYRSVVAQRVPGS